MYIYIYINTIELQDLAEVYMCRVRTIACNGPFFACADMVAIRLCMLYFPRLQHQTNYKIEANYHLLL